LNQAASTSEERAPYSTGIWAKNAPVVIKRMVNISQLGFLKKNQGKSQLMKSFK